MKSTLLLYLRLTATGMMILILGLVSIGCDSTTPEGEDEIETVTRPAFIPNTYTLIAHYPLDDNANDLTAQNDAMKLLNAPFERNGGIRVSGVYNASDATTPTLDAFNFDAFAISVDFNLAEVNHPIIVGGFSWRWMGAWVFSDSTLYMEANNYAFIEQSQARVIPGTDYTLTILYNGQTQRGRWFLNDTEVGGGTFSLNTGDDKTVTASHPGLGYTFNGVLSNLRIYSDTAARNRP